LRDLRKKKIAIYLGIKPRDFDRLAVVMNAFFQQAIGEQAAEVPEQNPALKHQLLVVLDEFTAIGRIPILLKSMAFVPGYNVRVLLVIQTPSQLFDLYGTHGAATMLRTLAVRIVFPPSHADDAHTISNELGFKTVKGISRTIPAMGVGQNRSPSFSVSDQRRALLLPQEIKQLPADQEILFMEHLHPVRCHKICYFEDALFKKRLLPAPGVPKQDLSQFHGGRMDDHFALWQQRERRPPERESGVVRVRDAEIDEPNEIEIAESAPYRPIEPEISPEREFPLDFSRVVIPAGRYLTAGELQVHADEFMKQAGFR
jgi:type IV secretion system protein VirD4